MAAVCGVNMLLLPQTFIACCQARMLSADGRCHTFDASASGYARGEGCGAQSLGPAGSAAPSVDSVAAFAGSALNQDGRSANLTSPNGPSQKAVIEVALLEGGLRPDDVGQARALLGQLEPNCFRCCRRLKDLSEALNYRRVSALQTGGDPRHGHGAG